MDRDRDTSVGRDRAGECRVLASVLEVLSVLRRDGILLEAALAPELADLLGDIERHGKVLAHPAGFAANLLDRLDEELTIPVLDDLPRPTVKEEDLLGLGQDLGQDKALVQGPDQSPGADVAESIGPLVGDEGERGIETVEGAPAGSHPVTGPGREPETHEVVDELGPFEVVEVRRRGGVPKRPQELRELEAPLRPERGDHLLGSGEPVAGPPGHRLDLAGIRAPCEDRRLLEVVVVQREDGSVDGPVEPMARTADTLDQPADLMR